ncbi:MAG: hypothetical protein J5858_13940, partial [Lentisphaeria bacterium]|nr:hypothetical protein [Lentisphaeria bacterium]
HSAFSSPQFCSEHFFSVVPDPGTSFLAEAEALLEEYRHAIRTAGCSADSEFLLRFHCSDITNQAPQLRNLLRGSNSFISMIGQPPAEGSRLALEAWHILPMKKVPIREHAVRFEFKNYQILLLEGREPVHTGSYSQTDNEFAELQAELAKLYSRIEQHTLRTWLYCRDVDNNYAGLVQARNHFFDSIGLTAETHFIASTGIEGASAVPSRLVTMDSLSFPGIDPHQICYLSAPEMLSPTAVYNVRFERGTRLIFGDRSHYYISGTASIDKSGQVLYVDDVRLQTRRLLDNVEALMHSSKGSLSDLKQATVYMRDAADAPIIREELEKRLPVEIPLVMLKAPVCRPAWLVEMETVGINPQGGNFLPLI